METKEMYFIPGVAHPSLQKPAINFLKQDIILLTCKDVRTSPSLFNGLGKLQGSRGGA